MFVIAREGYCKDEVYWMETQESPVQGRWVANIKKATRFSRRRSLGNYIKKNLLSENGRPFVFPAKPVYVLEIL